MAPGTPIAGDSAAEGGGSSEKHHRWSENSKVYTRKIHKKNPRNNPQPPPPPNSPPKPSSAGENVTPSEPPAVDDVTPTSPPDDASSLNHRQQEEDSGTIKIYLGSKSRDEIRELRKKFTDELEQVRTVQRKIESCYGGDECTQSQQSVAPDANSNGMIEGFEKEEPTLSYCHRNGNDEPTLSYCHRNGNDNRMIGDFEKEPTSNYHHLNGNGNGMIEGFEEEQTPNYHQLSGNENGMIKGFEKEEPMPNYHHLHGNSNDMIEGFGKEEGAPHYGRLSVSVAPETNCGMIERFEKEKRMPKANQLYRNSDFILIGKDKFPPPELSGGNKKKMKLNGYGNSNSFLEKKYIHAFKSCAALLAKLMKHKFGWVFNTPVDVKGLGLYDYYSIIKHPMDLGTVKSRLNKNWYKSPGEFAEDVRLTFRNAMTYNPKGQDVHIMAQQLSQIFEERWPTIEADSAYVPYPTTPVARKPIPVDVRMLERSDSTVHPGAMETKTKPVNYLTPTPTAIGRPPVLRQPKPKAKDLYKRDMTMEEKQKLSGHLQNLPPEKLDGVVQIIRKRNSVLCPQEDEIEIDIDCVDTETLWELDRFVTNYKKSLSKHKKKAELAILAKAEAERERGQERVRELGVVGEPWENKTVDDGKEEFSSFPVGGENKMVNGSRSSSSSSSSSDSGSSSSDSDSDSSSSSDAAH